MRKFLISSAAALALLGGPLAVGAFAQSLGDAPNYTPPHADPRPWAAAPSNGTGGFSGSTTATTASAGGYDASARVDHLGSQSGSDAKNTRNLRWPLQ